MNQFSPIPIEYTGHKHYLLMRFDATIKFSWIYNWSPKGYPAIILLILFSGREFFVATSSEGIEEIIASSNSTK